MATFNYNCAELPDHVLVDCNDFEVAGQSAIAIIDKDHAISDWSDAAEWNAAIAAGKVHVIQQISAEVPEASPVTQGSNNGGSIDQTVTYDRTAQWMDNNVSAANQAFYNSLNKRRGYLAVYGEDKSIIRVYVDKPVEFQAREVVPKTGDQFTYYVITARWRSKDMGAIYTAPAGIFE